MHLLGLRSGVHYIIYNMYIGMRRCCRKACVDNSIPIAELTSEHYAVICELRCDGSTEFFIQFPVYAVNIHHPNLFRR